MRRLPADATLEARLERDEVTPDQIRARSRSVWRLSIATPRATKASRRSADSLLSPRTRARISRNAPTTSARRSALPYSNECAISPKHALARQRDHHRGAGDSWRPARHARRPAPGSRLSARGQSRDHRLHRIRGPVSLRRPGGGHGVPGHGPVVPRPARPGARLFARRAYFAASNDSGGRDLLAFYIAYRTQCALAQGGGDEGAANKRSTRRNRR